MGPQQGGLFRDDLAGVHGVDHPPQGDDGIALAPGHGFDVDRSMWSALVKAATVNVMPFSNDQVSTPLDKIARSNDEAAISEMSHEVQRIYVNSSRTS